MLHLAIFVAVGYLGLTGRAGAENITLLIPHVHPNSNDLYLCTTMRLNSPRDLYITGYTPHASMDRAHHMLLYGCSAPGNTIDPAWNCGEMQRSDSRTFNRGGVCSRRGKKIIYAWARNAPALRLPDGVGFRVGGNSGVNYLVLQVHYVRPTATLDNSGVTIHTTSVPQPRHAGVYFMATNGRIPAQTHVDLDTACLISEDVQMHPFAFRTHTHKLGRVVSGYVIRNNRWHLIGKMDPQMPQMFYPARNDLTIQRGDILASRCYMYNFLHQEVRIGPTADHEMCNFYIMYWTEANKLPRRTKTCFSAGYPGYSWSADGLLNQPLDTHVLRASDFNHG